VGKFQVTNSKYQQNTTRKYVGICFLEFGIYTSFMRITKLHIENFRGFRGTHEIEFSDSNIHAIVGVNGVGKTSVLDAIGIILKEVAAFTIEGDRRVLIEDELNLVNVHSDHTSLTFYLNDGDDAIIQYDFNKAWRGFAFMKIVQPLQNLLESDDYNYITLIYYRSDRIFHQNGGLIDRIDEHGTNKNFFLEHYKGAFNMHTDFSDIFKWYLKQINIQNNEKVKRQDLNYVLPKLSNVTYALNYFFNNLQDTTLSKIEIDINHDSGEQIIVINKADGQIKFSHLSSGEKMVLGMVLDIAYRMSIANPQLENPLVSEGIVLIDELEQHLHPKWQMSILKALTATFPNVQFIVTTHSPLVINQLENHQLSILDDFKIISGKEVHKVYGRDVNAIIEDFMGASYRPLDVKTLMNDIEKLLDEDNPNTERARKKLDELKAIIDPNDYEVIKLETQIVMEEDETY